MVRLSEKQIGQKIDFISHYIESRNAADGSKFDSNANVTSKNIATLEAELNKDITIQVNRNLIKQKIAVLFGQELSEEYIRQIEDHEIYIHDETSLKPYCASISMYPFLLDGLTKLGGESRAPQHLESFCGEFVNLIFAVSSQFAGAIATVEFLLYFDYFARIDYGPNYLIEHTKKIENHLQHVIYAINQPAAARGYQSVFWNISIYDSFYFNSMFGSFVFPDGSLANWKNVDQLQRFFMPWFNLERQKAVLTFPIVTAAMLTNDFGPRDREFVDFCCQELNRGNSFFIYQSPNADSLSSCCRLRNEISDKTFSYTLGAGGVSTGSIKVITINFNRLIQKKIKLDEQVLKIQKYLVAYRHIIQEFQASGMLPVYDAGFISIQKQFLTIGINGIVEAAESLGIVPGNNVEYKSFLQNQLEQIYKLNKKAFTTFGFKFNTEFVPAENLGVKNASWDKADGLEVNRNCYNSYFYPVENNEINIVDKIVLHGTEIIQYLDGGSALHLNLNEIPSQEAYRKLIYTTAKSGCNYFCFNILSTICNDCNYIDKQTKAKCSKCGSNKVDYATRIIGYLKRVSHFSSPRQLEHNKRHYHIRHQNVKAFQRLVFR